MRKIILIIMMLGISGCLLGCLAANSVVQRVELPVNEDDNPYSILTLDSLGVVVVMKQNDLFASKPQRSVFFYDQNLIQRWRADIEVESYFDFVGYERESDSLRFFLMVQPESRRENVFLDIAVCLADGRYAKHYYPVDISSMGRCTFPFVHPMKDQWHFLALHKSGYSYMSFLPAKDSVFSYEVGSAREYDWCDAAYDTVSGRIFFLFRDAQCRETGLFLKVFSKSGRLLMNYTIPSPRSDLRLTDGKIILVDSSQFWIAGTWNLERSRQSVSTYDRGTETMGVFAMSYIGDRMNRVWMQPYLDFPKVDSLMGSRQGYQFAQAREKANGRLIMPDFMAQLRLFRQQGRIHLIAEVYDRLLNTTTDVSYDFYGRMVPYTRTTFDGYRYENAFHVIFGENLKVDKTWVFDLEQTSVRDNLGAVTSVMEDSAGRFLYAYNDKGVVYYRSFKPDGQFSMVKNFRIESGFAGDKVNKSWNEGMAYWYGDCFLVFGYEQVQNPRRKGRSRQNIFYMTKVLGY